jgi:YdjC-like protein
MKRIALCADDFGSFPGANRGILRLVDLGRLGGVSCQVVGASFAGGAPALRERAATVDAGLHLDLAAGRGGLAALLARSHARALDGRAVAREIASQLDAFERAFGCSPAFVDGHQHVHELPVVRDALLDVLERRYGRPGPLVRNTVPLPSRGAKAFAIAALGGFGLRRALRIRGVRHNADFAGVYALDGRADYAALFRGWLASATDGTLLLCHPGAAPADPEDPIGPARAAELAYLASDAFEEDCRTAGVARVHVGEVAG